MSGDCGDARDSGGSGEPERRVRAAIRGVIAFALTWGALSLAAWMILPRLEGAAEEWVVPLTGALFFVLAAGVGWVEFVRARRALRSGVEK